MVAGAVGVGAATGEARATPNAPPVPVVVHPESSIGWDARAAAATGGLAVGLAQVWMAVGAGPGSVYRPVSPGSVVPRDALDTTSRRTLVASFRAWLDAQGGLAPRTVHCLLANAPFAGAVGYGTANTDVIAGGETGAQCYVNVGATATWDGPDVTKNLAVHEVLHTFLDGKAAKTAVDTRCEHDLGSVVARTDGERWVSPMATAYADDTTVGGETRWHGSGCYDHDAFYRYDAVGEDEDVTWRHTRSLSEGTVLAVRDFLGRLLPDLDQPPVRDGTSSG